MLLMMVPGYLLACGPSPVPAGPSPVPSGPREVKPKSTPPSTTAVSSPTYLKGQLHLHSNASGDSDTPPEQVVRWYAEHGYDFIVFTDHNRITEAKSPKNMLVLPGIELTQNLPTCTPPPEPGLACLLHINGLLVGTDTSRLSALPKPTTDERLTLLTHAIEVTHALGGIAQLNHPNFHYAADAELVTALAARGLTLVEIANEAVDSNNAGDDNHPSTEALWDAALSAGAHVWGVATDDAHHYEDARAVRARGELAHTGDRGWVMVKATRDAASIRQALQQGDFYASNGVLLDTVDFDGTTLNVAVDPAAEGDHRVTFIGPGGAVRAQHPGRQATFTLPEDDNGYVRAVVEDSRARRAWTQPVWRSSSMGPSSG